MKRDLDRLMAERELDGFLVMGEGHGPVMKYLTNGGFFEGALLLKPRGEEVTLVHGMMERDTAAATGLRTVNREEHFNGYELLKEFEGDRLAASAAYIARAMEMMGLRGRVGVYGLQDAGATMALMSKVQEMIEEIEVVGEYGETLFSQAFCHQGRRRAGDPETGRAAHLRGRRARCRPSSRSMPSAATRLS